MGLGIFDEEGEAWYDRSPLGSFLKSPKKLPNKFVSDFDKIFRQNVWVLHANAKKALAARSIEDLPPETLKRLERRREWNLWRGADKLLDYFPSFKFSDSKLPSTCNPEGNVKLMCSTKKKGRFAGVARSRAIWIDAVETQKLLFKHRLRIQNYIDWGYKQNYVPIMINGINLSDAIIKAHRMNISAISQEEPVLPYRMNILAYLNEHFFVIKIEVSTVFLNYLNGILEICLVAILQIFRFR